jgi:hypothetical protein
VIVCAVPLPTLILIDPVSLSLELAMVLRVAVEVVALVLPEASAPFVTEALNAVSLTAEMDEVTVSAPDEPAVSEISERVELPSLVTTLAVAPRPLATTLEVTAKVPELPLVPEFSVSVSAPSEAVVTVAVNPRLVSALMVLAKPESVLTPLPV